MCQWSGAFSTDYPCPALVHSSGWNTATPGLNCSCLKRCLDVNTQLFCHCCLSPSTINLQLNPLNCQIHPLPSCRVTTFKQQSIRFFDGFEHLQLSVLSSHFHSGSLNIDLHGENCFLLEKTPS